MKIILTISILSLVFLFSCSKHEVSSFTHHDFNPDIHVKSIDSFYYPIPFYSCEQTPIPGDSTSSYLLDLNNDGISDFKFEVSHWVGAVSPSTDMMDPCRKFTNNRISVYSMNDELNSIFVKNKNDNTAHEFSEYDFISDELFETSKFSFLYYVSITDYTNFSPEQEEFYLGVKLIVNDKPLYGKILVNVTKDNLVIKEYRLFAAE